MTLRRKRCQSVFLIGLMALSLAVAGASMVTSVNGNGNGNGIRFSFTLNTEAGNLARITTAEIIKENLEDIGVEVNLQIVEWPTFVYEKILRHNFDAVLYGWYGGIDPDIKGLWHSENSDLYEYNFVGYNNSEVDDLLIETRGEPNITRRQEIFYKIQVIIADEAPYDFLVYPQTIIGIWAGEATQNWEGFVPGPQPNSLRSWCSIKNLISNDGSDTCIQESIRAPSNLNPVLLADSASSDVSNPLYPSVIFFDDSLNWYPEVADNWTIGGTYFEYKFNNTWQWTDGQKVTAEDYMFTLQLLQHANDEYSISQTPYSYKAEWIDDLYLVDGNPYHIKITVDLSQYPKGYVPGFTDLAIDFLPEHEFNNTDHSIWSTWAEVKAGLGVSNAEWNAYGGDGSPYWWWRWVEDSVNRHPQNTGVETPVTSSYWKFSSWDIGQGEITLVRNPNYPLWWQAKNPNIIQTFIYRQGVTQDVISLSLQAGGIDIQDGINPAYASTLEDDPNVQILVEEELTYTYMAFNLRGEPFSVPNVTRALCWAIDKEAIFNAAYYKYGSIGTGPIYKTLNFWYNPDVEDYYPPNPELAEEMLDDAGYPRPPVSEFLDSKAFVALAVIGIVVVFLRGVLAKQKH
ncbi:MAG: ABC transporter substrate-binding protein [Candidatus Hodarchaeota archaeon]